MRDLRQTLGNIGRAALELVWPKQVNCQGCGDVSGADREYLCAPCARRLEELRAPESQRCLGCGTGGSHASAIECRTSPIPDLLFTIRARCAALCKVSNTAPLPAWRIGWQRNCMGYCCGRTGWKKCMRWHFVPMPAKRLASRGYNQADLLAKALAEATGLPVLDLLERTRETPQQARLKGKERRENLGRRAKSMQGACGFC